MVFISIFFFFFPPILQPPFSGRGCYIDSHLARVSSVRIVLNNAVGFVPSALCELHWTPESCCGAFLVCAVLSPSPPSTGQGQKAREIQSSGTILVMERGCLTCEGEHYSIDAFGRLTLGGILPPSYPCQWALESSHLECSLGKNLAPNADGDCSGLPSSLILSIADTERHILL